MKKTIFYFAIGGWVLGLLTHLLAMGGVDVTGRFPFVWLLFVGIFAVWLPAVLHLRKSKEIQAFQQSGFLVRINPVTQYKVFLKSIFQNAPRWLMVVAIVSFVYGLVNFLLFMKAVPGVPEFKDGHYILQNHGHLIKNLTQAQYHHYRAMEWRGISGHILVFYSMAAAVLYPRENDLATTTQ